MEGKPELPAGDWPVSFDAVSLDQHLRFRALSAREKIRAIEGMIELVKVAHAQRKAKGLPVIERDGTISK
ncbi:MAG: hypothetical protein ACRES8_00685 [Nevskiaceae bacterium]